MPEYIRALIVIIVLATAVFAFAKVLACSSACTIQDFELRRNMWFWITIAAFLTQDIWIFFIVTGVLLLLAVPRESNRLSMFFFLLFVAPSIPVNISGLGLIKNLFELDYIRLLTLVVLFPSFNSLWKRSDIEPFGRPTADKLIAGYLILQWLLMLKASTFTNSLRHGVFYSFTDVFLPYYVASRSLENVKEMRDSMMGFLVAALVLCVIGVFETARHWLLYSSVADALHVRWALGHYLERTEGALRAQGSTGQSIALGYVIVVAAGFFIYLRRSVPRRIDRRLAMLLLGAGLIAALARGPWIGFAVMLLVFLAISPSERRGSTKYVPVGALVLVVLLASPAGEVIISYLPFVGNVDEQSVVYRQQLIKIGTQVVAQNPVFGASDYMYSPEMQNLRQGEGIIDIVNTYLAVALSSGLVGLSLFCGFFVAVAVAIIKGMKNLPDRDDDLHLLGRALLSTILGIMVIIFTVSSITVIPVIYWSVAGIGVSYARILASARNVGKPLKTEKSFRSQVPSLTHG